MNEFFRILITPVRGGSGAFLRAFENNPHVHGVHQPIKSSLRETGVVDYSIYQQDHPIYLQYPGKFIVAKETIGFVNEECTFNPFPDDIAIIESKPLFMFRDPFQTWNSWIKFEYIEQERKTDFDFFIISYQHTYKLCKNAIQVSSNASCLTLEKLGDSPQKIFPNICHKWGIPYDTNMLQWSFSFGQNTTFTAKAWQLITEDPVIQKSVEGLRKETTFSYRPLKQEELKITPDEKDRISQQLLPLYEEVYKLAEVYYPD